MVSTISRSIWTALINLRQCRNIKAVDLTMFLGLKVVLNLIYKGFRGPLRSFDAPFTYIDIDTCGVDKAHKRLELKL